MAPRKILVIKLRALGDTLLASAPLLELTRLYPQSEIHFMLPKAWVALFEGFPGVSRLWTYERRSSPVARARAVARFAHRLRQEKYDCVLNFHASPSSSLIAYATGAKVRSIHFHGHHHRDRYSTQTIPGKGTLKPILERDMDTVRALGIHVPAGKLPCIPLQPTEVQSAQHFLHQLGVKSPFLALSLGASRITKLWPIERFASLAIAWSQKEKSSVVAFTGPTEEALQKSFLTVLDELLVSEIPDIHVRSEVRSRISAINNLPLKKFAAILSQAAVWMGSDSGPKHLAVAVDTPTVTLFGPEDPFEWHPYPLDRNPYLFQEGLACRKDADLGMPAWCGLDVCKTEENKCMRQIGVDSVLQECQRVSKR